MEFKSILCYGDSNTWGYIPGSGLRYDHRTRWTGRLQKHLGSNYEVIEEGLSARTTVHEDYLKPGRNGRIYLMPCLLTHRPIDLVVLLLGTNDLKSRFSLSAKDIGDGIRLLSEDILNSDTGPNGFPPKLLILTPPALGRLSDYSESFQGSEKKSNKLDEYFQQVAKDLRCSSLNTGKYIVSSDVDGVHWEKEQHDILAKRLAKEISDIFKHTGK